MLATKPKLSALEALLVSIAVSITRSAGTAIPHESGNQKEAGIERRSQDQNAQAQTQAAIPNLQLLAERFQQRWGARKKGHPHQLYQKPTLI